MCCEYLISGKVQGVGYRYFARKSAEKQQLKGYAVNQNDGTVRVQLCGPAENITAVEKLLREGPSWSVVNDIERKIVRCSQPREFATG